MFSSSQRLGMFFPIMGGCLSGIAASFVLLFALVRWLRRTASKRKHSPDATDNIIFLNLMLADLIQAIGALPIIRWLVDGFITKGRLCTAQAVIKQVGGNGVALSSLAIALHTFCVLVLRWSTPKFTSKLVVLIIWSFIALVISIPYIIHRNEEFYGNVGYWCWVRTTFRTEQLVTQYIWEWVSLFLMIILYAIMFAVMRGWCIVDECGWHWYRSYMPGFGAGEAAEETQDEKDSKAMANILLLYPAVYLICIIPHSFARWRAFTGFNVPFQITLFGATLFSLSGMFNALLFFFTRPDLVVGSADSPPTALGPAIDLQTQAFDDRELTSRSSWQFGSSPDHKREYNAQPYNSMLLGEGATGNIRSSVRRVESDSGSHATSFSSEQSHEDFESNPVPAASVEKESFERLSG